MIEGVLKQVQRRYAPEVEGPADHPADPLPAAAGRAARGRVRRRLRPHPQQLATALDTLYAGTQLGDEAQRLSRFAAAREGKALAPIR